MRYSYEFKRKCVEMYHRGEYPETPNGISEERFHLQVRNWVRIVESCGPDALRHKNQNKEWTPEERYALVARVLAGESNKTVALSSGINEGQLYQWVRKYKIYGYNGLISKQKGRKPKDANMKKIGTRKPQKPNESEYEELIRLRTENAYMKAEIEVIKKEIALREEKEAARLKAKKQRSSKNSEKMDSN
ncbi:Transposase [Pseudobutyrivibrio ruminis]|uniref:Transposase n=4 Tax=Pseudobutyrivibrio ruminis TaxID=46206 RepID=A0A1H7M969_9FIRM|nr:helix-turn-helix domain-containing protein [Pseudobutyrivibrio ruminis]SEL07860.1 Transposase [Pseudobutyrivibrio ruminis]